MNSRKAFALLVSLALAPWFYIVAQNASSALPQDPMALTALAHDKNGLVGSDVKPWHIRGTYRSFDAKGNLEYEGVYEEWWVNATKYKLSFTNPKFTQTDYATGAVLLRDGSQDWESGPELLLRASLLEPLPGVTQLKEFRLQKWTQAVGQSNVECVSLTYPIRTWQKLPGDFYPAACFEPAKPVLRIYSEGAFARIIYDRIVSFQEHYLAGQIQVFMGGKLSADMNLDVVETLKESPDTVLAAPATELPVDLNSIQLKCGGKCRWPVFARLKWTFPAYSEQAKSLGMGGRVNIEATIGPEGHVESMQPIGGSKLFRQGTLDAVRQWIYRPFDVMGQPRPVEFEIHVLFTSMDQLGP